MKYQEKQYSGQKKLGYYLEIFGKTFSFARKNIPYDSYDVVRQEHPLKLTENFYLPISWGKIENREYKNTGKIYTKEEAAQKAQEKLDKFLQKIQEKGVQIFQNNVKIETDGKNCRAVGDIIVIEKAGKRVERTIGE